MAYLPSKKVLSFFIITVGLVTSIIIALGRDKASTAINYAGNIVAGNRVTLPENPEWQNDLVLTNDTILEEQPLATSTQDTLTDTVSKTVLGNYLLLKQNGTLNQQSAETLVDQSIKIIESEGVTAENPVLKITQDNSKTSIQNYGEELGLIIKNNTKKDPSKDFNFIIEAIKSADQEKIDELQKTIDTQEKIANEMAAMVVPQSLVKNHTDMIMGLKQSSSGLEKLKMVLKDPMLGFLGLNMFKEGSIAFSNASIATKVFIDNIGIVYKQGSGGYYLIYDI